MAKNLSLDENAESIDPELPAFLSRPKGKPPYYGFPLIEETNTDGWIYGTITVHISNEECQSGDGFVQAPNGDRAGIVWETGNSKVETICGPDDERWGVLGVSFPKGIRNMEDLVYCFREILPQLKEIYVKYSNG